MSTYTPSLGLELITPGSQAGLWGNTTNNSLNLIDQAITGVTPISFATASGTTYTLTDYNGAEDESRAAVLNVTGTATGANTVVIPNKQKTYLVRNDTGQDVTFQTASPTATYVVGAGYSILIFCDGNNNVFTGIASPSVGTLSVNAGGTGATTFTAGFVKSTGGTNALTSSSTVNLATETTGTLPVTRGGTGVTSFTSGGVLIGNGTGNLATVTASTTGYVLTWNGSQWVAAASASGGVTSISGLSPIVVTGTTTPTISLSTVPVASGGTGQTSWTSGGAVYAIGSTTLTSGTLPVTAGGTGLASLTSGGAVYASSSSTMTSGTLPVTAGGTGGTTLDGAGIVTKSGTQTITGPKTFSGGITVSGANNTFDGAANIAIVGVSTNAEGQYKANSGGNGWHFGYANGSGDFVLYSDTGGYGCYVPATGTSWVARSDYRLKTDLAPVENALDKLDGITGYTGRYKTDAAEQSRLFLIAQEVQSQFPQAVSSSPKRDMDGDGIPDGDSVLAVSYSDLVPVLVQAIKELKAEVAALKAAK